jgi:hypothetical protein
MAAIDPVTDANAVTRGGRPPDALLNPDYLDTIKNNEQ